jgi:hypothetical protein
MTRMPPDTVDPVPAMLGERALQIIVSWNPNWLLVEQPFNNLMRRSIGS